MTAQAIALMAAIQSLMAVAPDVIAFGYKAKGWIDDMFSLGLIPAEVQNALHARLTELCRAALNGETPKHWQVEPDPE